MVQIACQISVRTRPGNSSESVSFAEREQSRFPRLHLVLSNVTHDSLGSDDANLQDIPSSKEKHKRK
jgi:hypothetical protein